VTRGAWLPAVAAALLALPAGGRAPATVVVVVNAANPATA
jgi:hypothetical protein